MPESLSAVRPNGLFRGATNASRPTGGGGVLHVDVSTGRFDERDACCNVPEHDVVFRVCVCSAHGNVGQRESGGSDPSDSFEVVDLQDKV